MSGLLVAYNLAYADYPSNNVRNIFRRRNDDYNRLSPKVLKNNRLKTVAKERELSSEAHKRTRQLSKFEQSKVYRRITERAESSVSKVLSKNTHMKTGRVTPNLDPVRGTNIDLVG